MGLKIFPNIVQRQIYDYFGMSNNVRKYLLLITDFSRTNYSVSFRYPHPNLSRRVHHKHQHLISKFFKLAKTNVGIQIIFLFVFWTQYSE